MSYRKPSSPLPESDQTSYASSTSARKVGAFRERTRQAGFKRQEILVSEDTAERLAVIARAQGTSVVNAASGLLEMGLAHYAALLGMGRVQPVNEQDTQAYATTDSVPPALGSVTGQATAYALNSSGLLSRGSAPPGSGMQEILSALVTPPVSESAPCVASMADPIQSFFAKRKQSPK